MTSHLEIPAPISKYLVTWGSIGAMRASVMACKFGLAIFISRYMDLASLGAFGLVAGAVAMGPAVIALGMVHSLMRDAVTMPRVQLADGLRHYWGFTTAVYAALLPLALATGNAFGLSAVSGVVVAIMLFEHLGNDIFQLFSNLERPLLANLTAFLRGAAWIMAYVPLALWDPQQRTLAVLLFFWLVGGASAFAVFVLATWSWPWKSAFRLPFRLSWLAARIQTSFVIYVSDISYIASQYLDRYLVTLFLGIKLAGVYVLYWTVANAMYTFVSMAVLQQQRPFLIKAHHESATAHRHLSARLLQTTTLATVALGLAIAGAFQLAVPILHQPLAMANLTAFWIIVAGLAVRCVADFGAMALFTARRDRTMTVTNVVAIVLLALTQAALLPTAGLYGAGAAILLTFGAITVWRYRLLFAPAVRGAGA